MRWTLEQVAQALGVSAPCGVDPVARLAGVSIDSRTLRAGELFFAIHGPRHDGHSYVAEALAAGAPAAVVARERLGEYPEGVRGRLFAAEDTLVALQQLARAVRREWARAGSGRRLGAVTGSTGKTTTREIWAALLATRFRVLKSEGNLNNDYGLPLTLLRLDDDDAGVVELGMNHRGELARLTAIAEPEIGLVTNVVPVHLEFFATLEEIAQAKRELIEGLAGPEPVAVLNADDARVARFAEGFHGRVVRFGTGADAEFRAESVEDRGAAGSAFDCVSPAGRARLELPLVGRHNVMNALAALAVASVWGVGIEEARQVFPLLRPVAMRGEVLQFEEGFTVINDCYNSNPVALASMLDLLVSAPGYRRRILVAGEMLELGPTSAELHCQAGARAAATQRIAWIFGVQGTAAELVRGAVEAGQPETCVQFFENSEEAARFFAEFVAPGDLVLVKGSRGVRMERIIEALKQRFALAPQAGGD
jgi:UDP-N-acetylmuramoyl-tripeptide--D-alanyl-D-alanine ligase